MAKVPTVALIGRPNTGKSTLFNRLVGKRRAIVSDVPGTTRDHVAHKMHGEKVDYLLLDTGGIGGGSDDVDFEDNVSAQTQIAIEAADLIVFTVDSKNELTSSDYEVVQLLRTQKRSHIPVILVASKCDNIMEADQRIHEYYSLNLTEHICAISSVHNMGIVELEDMIEEQLLKLHFGKEEQIEISERSPRIALIGKPNVGKSSIINALMSDPQRELSPRIVSDKPGTTRDSSDTIIKHEDKEYVFVDTAGLRRKSRVEESLEYLSNVKSLQAVQDCDITVLVLDASDTVSRQDKRIANMAIEEGKGIVIAINKGDLLSGEEKKEKEAEVRASFPFCRFAPIIFVSALSKTNLVKMFPVIEAAHRNRMRRIPAKELLRWYETASVRMPARQLSKSKFISQAEGVPPTFVVFVKQPKKVDVSQLRSLDNSLRSTFGFEGTPIRWITKTG